MRPVDQGTDRAMPMLDATVGWGVLGGSGFAASTAAPAVMAAGRARLVAVVSRAPVAAERSLIVARGLVRARRLGGHWLADRIRYGRIGRRLEVARRLGSLGGPPARVVDRLDALLADPAVEAVWIATPPHLHPEQAITALEAGKHVLCEKPMATTAADARRMRDAAERAGRLLGVGYHMRYHPALANLRHESSKGRVDRLAAELLFRHPDPRPWHRSRALSGGWAVCEAGTHLIHLALWFLGPEVVGVDATLSNDTYGFETDDRAKLRLTFRSGAEAVLTIAARNAPPKLAIELVSNRGTVRGDGFLMGATGTITRTAQGRRPWVERVPAVNVYRDQVKCFGRAIRGDRPDRPLVTADDGVRNLEIIERARGW